MINIEFQIVVYGLIMNRNDRNKKNEIKAFLRQVDGPEIPFGKHSKYYRTGNKIVVITKKNDEELPEDIVVDMRSRVVIFEDSKGNVKYRFDVILPSKNTHPFWG